MFDFECLTVEQAVVQNAVCDPYGGLCNPEVYNSCGPDCPPSD